ncbi:hypothetical protein TSAR_013635 [Trichomalopsis sarcophagae]|uniref:Peptidase M13 N-terminal domain-containing protein n=1 Tax=Trichomalopsis sarcophagae TaxID=543379 RepID=A0A232EVI0_9HYME|nr:hypothetical protein TSAR_013635 [Trichomalopsis sarcophagae]
MYNILLTADSVQDDDRRRRLPGTEKKTHTHFGPHLVSLGDDNSPQGYYYDFKTFLTLQINMKDGKMRKTGRMLTTQFRTINAMTYSQEMKRGDRSQSVSRVALTCSLYCTSAKINRRFVESIDDIGDIRRTKCTDDTIVSKINKTVKPCESMYSYMCNGEENYQKTEYPNNVLLKIQTHAMNILSSPVESSEPKFFNVDKELYQQCIKLGMYVDLCWRKLRANELAAVFSNVTVKYEQAVIGKAKSIWRLKIYDVSLVLTTLQLQPPSLKHMQTVTNKMIPIMKRKYNYEKVKYFGEFSAFDDLFDFVKEYLKEPVQVFLDSLCRIESTVLQKYREKRLLNIKTTIGDFDNFFEQLSEINEFAKIDWATIIRRTFQKVDIQVTDKEKLSKLLNKTPNNVIVSAVLAKLITENLVYIDWNLSQTLETVNKQSFCLKETKLYGVSHKILYKYIADRSDILLLRRVEDIVANIAEAFVDEILKTYTLFSRERIYLERKLKSITDDLLDHGIIETPQTKNVTKSISRSSLCLGIYHYDIPDWFAYPEYSEDTMSCYESIGIIDFNRHQVMYMITETLGLQIAYQAMLKDNHIKSHNPFSINLLSNNKITMGQLFFSAYVKDHCYANNSMVNKILLNSGYFSNVFNCYNYKILKKCPLQAFDMHLDIRKFGVVRKVNIFGAACLAIYVVSAFAVPIENSLNNIDAVWISNEIHSQNKQNNGLLSVLSGLDKAVDPCEDAYSYACKNGEKIWTQEYLQKIYPEVRNSLIKILSQKPTKKEVHSLSIEKQLFQQCMNLGANETSEAKDEKEVLIARLFEHVFRPNANWKNIDEALNIIGFGHPFFDINVERDPENPSHNIVSLRPPSHAHIKHIKHLITKAFETSKKSNLITNVVDSISTESKNTILNFLSILHPLVFFTTTQTGDAEKIKLNNLNSIGNNDEFAINLRQKIESDRVSEHFPEFKDFLKSQDSNDKSNNSVKSENLENNIEGALRIRNHWYIKIRYIFILTQLSSYLGGFDRHVEVIKFKVLIENLRYIEWKSANSLEHIKRSIFCFGDTKLYGASFKLNRDLRKDTHKEGQYYELVQNMLHEIVDVINTEISNSKIIFPAEKAYFVSEMKLITANALHQNREYVSEYYRYNGQDFEFGSSYFSNIIRYRKLLQRIEMSKLKDTSKSPRPEPYSITDLDRPSNRLFVNSHYSPLSPELPKEIHYSVYGVKIASFLFGLFNEQKRVDALQARHRDDWSAHPTYSKAAIDCFTSSLEQYDKELPKETLTELFGLRIAYKAMLKDYLNEGSRKYFVPELAREGLTADQMFFASYARYHCYYGKRMMNTILSNVDAFSFANNCYEKTANDLPKCHLKGFEIQENNLLSRA